MTLRPRPHTSIDTLPPGMGVGRMGLHVPSPCGITVVATDYKGMLDQPKASKYKGALVQSYVQSEPYGGCDKSKNSHRYDSIPIVNGMINAGMSCELVHYLHKEHETFFKYCERFKFIIVRCTPGQIEADGGDQEEFDKGMRNLRKRGIQVWPAPDVMEKMGAKDALCKVAHMNISLKDTLAYYSPVEFSLGFKKTMAFQPRVISRSFGEGIWIIKLKDGSYCKEYGDRSCDDAEKLVLMEVNDIVTEEEQTVAEFIELMSKEWTSESAGKYVMDERHCPRAVEGELRYNLIGDTLIQLIHQKPQEEQSPATGGTDFVYTFHDPEEGPFASLTENLRKALPDLMPSLGLTEEPLPLWWTIGFINASPQGTNDEKWIVSDFTCACEDLIFCLDACQATWDDISEENKAKAKKLGDLMGKKALAILAATG